MKTENTMFFISFLKKIKEFIIHFHNCHKEDNCSWCAKEVGRDKLTRIWYTETADDVCDSCLNPPQSIKFIRS